MFLQFNNFKKKFPQKNKEEKLKRKVSIFDIFLK